MGEGGGEGGREGVKEGGRGHLWRDQHSLPDGEEKANPGGTKCSRFSIPQVAILAARCRAKACARV